MADKKTKYGIVKYEIEGEGEEIKYFINRIYRFLFFKFSMPITYSPGIETISVLYFKNIEDAEEHINYLIKSKIKKKSKLTIVKEI